MNRTSHVTVNTPFGDFDHFITIDLLKQGTCLGPILKNCSLSNISTKGKTLIVDLCKSLEFVDDLEDPNSGKADSVLSNDKQTRKRLNVSTEKCKLLIVNSKDNEYTISISGERVEIKTAFRYLGDIFNCHGDNSETCKEIAGKAIGTRIEIISQCKEK